MPEFGMRRGGGGGGRGGGRGGRDNRDDYLNPESEQFRKLFIGGLSYETTEDGLKNHFEQWGELVDCVVMKDPNSKRSRGFGFVTYKEAAMLDEAQKNRPHSIDGREIESKRAMPRAESGRQESQATTNKMFIGGMKDDTTEDQIKDVFSQYGEISEVDIIKDKGTQKPKGFAFVQFQDYDSVDKCVLICKFDLNGKKVDVKKAKAKDKEKGGAGGRGGGRGGRDFGGQGGYGSGGYGSGYGNQGGYGSSGGQGGYGNNSWGGNQGGGGYDNYGSYGNQGGGGNWGNDSFGSGYGNNYGGGPMRGGNNYSQRDNGPYGSGYGSSGGGNSSYGGGSGYGSGYNRR